MTAAPTRPQGAADPGLSFRPFVALIAAIMAVNALGIDSMLPALPAIGHALHIATENQRQWIIFVYVFGFGLAQLVYGPLADRYGRRPLLIGGMLLYGVLSLVAGLASSFALLLVARLLQGIAAAASRVLAVSIIRDCYSGRQMARVMSLSFMVFLAVPVLAPTLGSAVLLVASWRWIFLGLAGFAAVVSLAALLFLKETLHPEFRQPISPRGIAHAVRLVVTDRLAIGYTLAGTLTFAALMGFINSVEQIVADTFHRPAAFPVIFACVAGSMAAAAFTNSRIVERLGTRQVSHAALIGFTLIGTVHAIVAASGHETLASFLALQCPNMFCFGLIGANFGSMAMERMGHIAGTASSVQGFIQTTIGSVIGLAIGQAYDGTTVPVAAGFALVGVGAIGLVLWTERGKLFRVQHGGMTSQPANAA